jgi:hypothetical protein
MPTQHQVEVAWVKQCPCSGPSSSPTIKIDQSMDHTMLLRITVTFSPGPQCDGCGEPWRRVERQQLREGRG